jgi:hypothetical protein
VSGEGHSIASAKLPPRHISSNKRKWLSKLLSLNDFGELFLAARIVSLAHMRFEYLHADRLLVVSPAPRAQPQSFDTLIAFDYIGKREAK